MNEKDRSMEMERFAVTLQEINKQLTANADDCTNHQNDLKDTFANYWENIGRNIADEAQFVEMLARQKNITTIVNRRYQQLKKMVDSPYFGRIDFSENTDSVSQETDMIYIGISNLTNQETGAFLIYDWRTPVAGMYYDFERGPAWYECPAGIINGVITLKRQYKITDGQIKYMFNSDLKIDDEILQELLSKSVDDKMHTIITSIQREQNRIIRDNKHPLLFVQGPAGSGKTSIALHRIAYLLYQNRDTLTSKNVIILSPNHIFSDYISNVLPEIGEENVLQTTFQDYITHFKAHQNIEIENRTEHLEALFSYNNSNLKTRITNIRYKSSAEFENVIENYIAFLDKRLILDYPVIRFDQSIIFDEKDWHNYYLNHFSFLPVVRRLAKIREIILLRLRPLVHELRQKKLAEIIAAGKEINKKVMKALARMYAHNELQPVIEQINQLTLLNPLLLYRQLFEDENLFLRFAAEKKLPCGWTVIRSQTLSALEKGSILYEDSFPVTYFQGMLEGFPINYDIKHVVIDEAQDYNTFQYKILAQLFPNCSWTILGDSAQAIHPYLQTAAFQQASRIIENADPVILRLTKSYRSTKEIQVFCQALLPDIVTIDGIDRHGPLPQLIQLTNNTPIAALLSRTIRQLEADGLQSIALICKTAAHCETLYQLLSSRMKITLIMDEDDTFHQGIVLIPSYLSKGLEFDAVLALDVDAKNYGRAEDRPLLYTVCTRALHRLLLYYRQDPSPLITAVKHNLYHTL